MVLISFFTYQHTLPTACEGGYRCQLTMGLELTSALASRNTFTISVLQPTSVARQKHPFCSNKAGQQFSHESHTHTTTSSNPHEQEFLVLFISPPPLSGIITAAMFVILCMLP